MPAVGGAVNESGGGLSGSGDDRGTNGGSFAESSATSRLTESDSVTGWRQREHDAIASGTSSLHTGHLRIIALHQPHRSRIVLDHLLLVCIRSRVVVRHNLAPAPPRSQILDCVVDRQGDFGCMIIVDGFPGQVPHDKLVEHHLPVSPDTRADNVDIEFGQR